MPECENRQKLWPPSATEMVEEFNFQWAHRRNQGSVSEMTDTVSFKNACLSATL
jgi:hypothetical protein